MMAKIDTMLFVRHLCAYLFLMMMYWIWIGRVHASTVTNTTTTTDLPRRYVVSMTTIPGREANVARVVESLRAQTHPPAYVIVHVPKTYVRFPNARVRTSSLPDDVIVHTVPTDYGPATKLLGMVHFDRNDFDAIVVVDDDTYKHPEWAETLVRDVSAEERPVVSALLDPKGGARNRMWNTFPENVYGYMGFAVNRARFRRMSEAMVRAWTAQQSGCFRVDDDFFTFYFTTTRVPIAACYYPSQAHVNQRWVNGPHALSAAQGADARGPSQQACQASACRFCDPTKGERCDAVCDE